MVLPSWTSCAPADGRGRAAASSCGHQPAGGGADDTEAGLAGDVGVARRHVGGDVVHLVQDPTGALDDTGALVGEPALRAVDQA